MLELQTDPGQRVAAYSQATLRPFAVCEELARLDQRRGVRDNPRSWMSVTTGQAHPWE